MIIPLLGTQKDNIVLAINKPGPRGPLAYKPTKDSKKKSTSKKEPATPPNTAPRKKRSKK